MGLVRAFGGTVVEGDEQGRDRCFGTGAGLTWGSDDDGAHTRSVQAPSGGRTTSAG